MPVLNGERVFNLIGTGMGLTILSGLIALDCNVHRREILAKELRPYVEAADDGSGISQSDRIDFARRANLPEWMLKEMYQSGDFRLEYYLPSQLERALQSYKEEVK